MSYVPQEVIARQAFIKASEYFASLIEERRKKGQVAILIEDSIVKLYFANCDQRGYPKYFHFETIQVQPLSALTFKVGEIPTNIDISVKKVSIQIQKPILSSPFDYQYPCVFLWSARTVWNEEVPLENLNVSELMKLAQEAVKNREGLIIDEVLKNKIYR